MQEPWLLVGAIEVSIRGGWVDVTMTPGWPCNKPDLTIKGTSLYSAAMTPGKHGPHKYP